jgi:hypothetical protein
MDEATKVEFNEAFKDSDTITVDPNALERSVHHPGAQPGHRQRISARHE